MQVLLALVSCLLATTQGFVVPLPAGAMRAHSHMAVSSSPSPAEVVGLSTHPLAGRKIQFSDQEDSSERVTQVLLSPDGTLSMISDNTNAVAISGNWRPAEASKVGFILERIYTGSGDSSSYSMTRIYEAEIIVSNGNIRGEGKIEMEKYSAVITVGYFSLVSVDDAPDDIDKLGGGHAVLEGVDQ